MSKSDISEGMEEAGLRALNGWLDEEGCITRFRAAVRDVFVAMAILDRLLHHSHVITIRGDSYRLREKRRAGLFKSANSTLTESTAT